MSLPSEFERIVPTVELDIGGTWVDVQDRLILGKVSVTRGRQDEQADSSAASTDFLLDNIDGALTPRDPRSPWYPYVKRGMECRVLVDDPAGTSLHLPGDLVNNASTPDNAALDIPGDFALWFDGDIDWSSGWVLLQGKWDPDGDQRSWSFWLADGLPVLYWSTDGTFSSPGFHASAPVNPATGSPNLSLPWVRGRHALAVEVDIDDGLGNWVAQWYMADTAAGPWVPLGDPNSQPDAPAPIFNSTPPLEVGTTSPPLEVTSANTAHPPIGKVFSVGVLSGDLATGTQVANPDFATQPPGTTGFTDAAGRPWTVNGSEAEITDKLSRFRGHAFLDPRWPHGDNADIADAVVDVSAAGVLRRLTQGAKPLDATLYRRITSPDLAGTVVAYWPMEDGSGAGSIASPTPGIQPMSFGGDLSLASDDTLPSSKPLPTISGDQSAGFAGQVPRFTYTDNWAVDLVFRIPTFGSTLRTILSINSTGRIASWQVRISSSLIGLEAYDADGALIVNSFGANSLPAGEWLRVRVQATQNGGNVDWRIVWYVVGVGAFAGSGSFAGLTGRPTSAGALLTAPANGISYGHLTIARDSGPDLFPLSGGVAADSAYAGEPAGDRFVRLCTEEGIPYRIISAPTPGVSSSEGGQPMGPQRPNTLVDLLQECAVTDLGILADRMDVPGLEYRTGPSMENQDPALALDAGHGASPWIPGDITDPFAPADDDQALTNDVTVSREGGSSARAVDQASIDEDGLYDIDETVNIATDGQLPNQAGWRLHLGTWPDMRYPELASELTVAQDGALTDWLAVDLGDRLTVDRLPVQHPMNLIDQLIQGWTETLTPTRWTVQPNCTPAGPWEVAVRDDDVRGKRDNDGSTLATDFESGTDTSMSVASTNLLWTTVPGEFPFDLDVGGVRLTVTAISGASSPQTFTITQTPVNGIEKTIPAGTEVHIRRGTDGTGVRGL